jgi:hypothetical protein
MKLCNYLPILSLPILGLLGMSFVIPPRAQAKPPELNAPTVNFAQFTPPQQAYLTELVTQVSSKLYLSRIRHQPESYVAVGEQVCADMRQQGYAALLAQQTRVAGAMTLQSQPMGNGSYRGNLQLQMGRTMLDSARRHLCPDAPQERP